MYILPLEKYFTLLRAHSICTAAIPYVYCKREFITMRLFFRQTHESEETKKCTELSLVE